MPPNGDIHVCVIFKVGEELAVTTLAELGAHVIFCAKGNTVDEGVPKLCVTTNVCVLLQPDAGLTPVTDQVPKFKLVKFPVDPFCGADTPFVQV